MIKAVEEYASTTGGEDSGLGTTGENKPTKQMEVKFRLGGGTKER